MFFGNSAKYWLGLQIDFDLENEKAIKVKEFSQIKQILIEQ
jgi:plasmid maintenance system antidote protein VapI